MIRKTILLKLSLLAGVVCLGCFSMIANAQTTSVKAADIPVITLNNGMKIPQIGFGTWALRDEEAVRSVKTAIEKGYRLIDTAQFYKNEAEVYQGIKESGIDRKDVFITTKIFSSEMRDGTVRESIERSLKLLGDDYIDILLIHWPLDKYHKQTWEIMEEYVQKGKVKAIGVSNFSPEQVKELLTYARIKPVINQIEVHPYRTQADWVKSNQKTGIAVETYSPLGQGKVFKDETLLKLAKKYNRTIPQVVLRWHIQNGRITIPRSRNEKHIAENINIFDFTLSKEDLAIIDSLDKDESVIGATHEFVTKRKKQPKQ